MTFWSPENFKTVLGAAWVARPHEPRDGIPLAGVCTDTRSAKPGEAFIALRGERTDGHAYLADAAAAGCSLLIIDRDAPLPPNTPVLRVPDSAGALLALAQAYRRTLDATRVIAVAGSNGKTTTVRMIESVLSRTLRGTASIRSFNNAVGVPLTILRARRTDQFLVCEVGTNAPGEIAALAAVVAPDVGVVVSVGREHLEGLGSLKGVVAEEASLFASLREGGTAVISADSPPLVEAVRPGAWPGVAGVIRFGFAPAADLRVTDAAHDAGGVSFSINGRGRFRVPLLGLHNASNAAAAIAVARRLAIDQAHIEAGLAQTPCADMRLQRTLAAGVEFVNDAYNANPESMLAALDTFASLDGATSARRVIILGDMLELGQAAPGAHAEIGAAVAALATRGAAPALLILLGPLGEHAAREARRALGNDRVLHLPAADAPAIARAAALLRPGDLVLLKGSRGMGLERVISAVRAFPHGAEPKDALAGRPGPA